MASAFFLSLLPQGLVSFSPHLPTEVSEPHQGGMVGRGTAKLLSDGQSCSSVARVMSCFKLTFSTNTFWILQRPLASFLGAHPLSLPGCGCSGQGVPRPLGTQILCWDLFKPPGSPGWKHPKRVVPDFTSSCVFIRRGEEGWLFQILINTHTTYAGSSLGVQLSQHTIPAFVPALKLEASTSLLLLLLLFSSQESDTRLLCHQNFKKQYTKFSE